MDVSRSGSESDSDAESQTRKRCHSKGATLARENRRRKKRYVNGLVRKASDLRRENERLNAVADTQQAMVEELRNEVRYLRAALTNSKRIADLVRRLERSPVGERSPRLCHDLDLDLDLGDELFPDMAPPDSPWSSPTPSDHNYSAKLASVFDDDEPPADVGVCLHVRGHTTSLEFCSACNDRALRHVRA